MSLNVLTTFGGSHSHSWVFRESPFPFNCGRWLRHLSFLGIRRDMSGYALLHPQEDEVRTGLDKDSMASPSGTVETCARAKSELYVTKEHLSI